MSPRQPARDETRLHGSKVGQLPATGKRISLSSGSGGDPLPGVEALFEDIGA